MNKRHSLNLITAEARPGCLLSPGSVDGSNIEPVSTPVTACRVRFHRWCHAFVVDLLAFSSNPTGKRPFLIP